MNHNKWSDCISNEAVSTVLKCLGMSINMYYKCMYYREMRWNGMCWTMDQYSGMIESEVIPYFKNNSKGG